MCRVAGLSETPGSWRSSSGKGEAGKETGGKRGTGRGGRDRLGETERHLHRERPRQRDGEIEAGQQRAREGQAERTENESMWGKSTHTLRDRRTYTEVGKERKRERRSGEERWGGRERQRERERRETAGALSKPLYQTGVGQSQDHAVGRSWGRVNPIRMPPSHTPLRAAVRCRESDLT